MRRSFALRLAAAFAGVGIAAATLAAILVNVAFGTRFTSYLEEQRSTRQEQLVAAVKDSYVRMGGWDLADLRSLDSLALMDGGEVRLADASGRAVWSPSSGPAGSAMAQMHRQMMGSGPLGPPRAIPVEVGGTLVGTLHVRLPQAGLLPQDVSFRSSMNRLLVAGGVVAGLVALILGAVLARRATAPARELTRAARAVAAGEGSRRVGFEAADEFGEMARAFNSMADTIEEEDRLRRTFAADVAHELRTPLAILRTQVEAMQDGVLEPSSPSLASLHEETLRLTRLVEDLEALASADAAAFSLDRRPVDLREVLEGAVREFAGPFDAAGVGLEARMESLVVEADPLRIRQVVSNLLWNALKHTPSGGKVRVRLEPGAGGSVVRVSDTGPGIPPDELPHVFDRFFRGRGARAGGSGIGLTVARELVRAHGGEIEAANEPAGGATFTVRLPRASSAALAAFTAPSNVPATVGAKGGQA